MTKQLIVNNQLISYIDQEPSTDNRKTFTLLFLHGWRSQKEVWSKVINEFSAEGYRCLALDLPGFGASELPKEPFTTDDYAAIVKEFITKLNLENVIPIGHSYGGRTLINIAINDREFFKKIVLVDSSGVDRDKNKINLFKIGALIAKPLFKPEFMQPLRRRIYRAIGADDYVEASEIHSTYINIVKDDYTHSIHKIIARTLIIWGENDPETPVSKANTLHSQIGSSELVIIKNAGHYPYLDKHDEFVEKLFSFISNE